MELFLTFEGVSSAMQAERVLRAAGLPVGVAPLPPAIRAGCGFCLRLRRGDVGAARRALSAAGIPAGAAYQKAARAEAPEYLLWEGDDED